MIRLHSRRPGLIPKLQHRRDKLFFFWSEEFLPKKAAAIAIRRTMPTAAERSGDFSQTLDTNGKVITHQRSAQRRQAISRQHHSLQSHRQGRTGPAQRAGDAERRGSAAYVQLSFQSRAGQSVARGSAARRLQHFAQRNLFYFRLVQFGGGPLHIARNLAGRDQLAAVRDGLSDRRARVW